MTLFKCLHTYKLLICGCCAGGGARRDGDCRCGDSRHGGARRHLLTKHYVLIGQKWIYLIGRIF